jgi:hypothetical protein
MMTVRRYSTDALTGVRCLTNAMVVLQSAKAVLQIVELKEITLDWKMIHLI